MHAVEKKPDAALGDGLGLAAGSADYGPKGGACLRRGMVALVLLLLVGLLSHSPSLAARSEGAFVTVGPTRGANFAIADFDGDQLPDVVTVETGPSEAARTRYWIQFTFGRGRRASVAVSGPAGGLQIASQDVNGDSFLDVIVSTALANEPVAVLLNDGAGNFGLADAGNFSRAIWESRAEWRIAALGPEQGGSALVGGRWDALFCGSRHWNGVRLGLDGVALVSEDWHFFVTPWEVRGRAPPLA